MRSPFPARLPRRRDALFSRSSGPVAALVASLLLLAGCQTPAPMLETPPSEFGGAIPATPPAGAPLPAGAATPVPPAPTVSPAESQAAALAAMNARLKAFGEKLRAAKSAGEFLQTLRDSLAVPPLVPGPFLSTELSQMAAIAYNLARSAELPFTPPPGFPSEIANVFSNSPAARVVSSGAAAGASTQASTTTSVTTATAVTATAAVQMAGPGGGGGGGGLDGLLTPVRAVGRIFREDFTTVGVLYATDRRPVIPLPQWRSEVRDKGSDHVYYGAEHEQNGALRFGLCTVTVPKTHVQGTIERNEWGKREDLAMHITISGLFEFDEAEMKRRITVMSAPDKDAFIFIHGYNVKFNAAAMRAAQLAYDFNFLGTPILYSWTSCGDRFSYPKDEVNVTQTVAQLHRFIKEVVLQTGARKLHLVAHSMGNRALVAALKKFAEEGGKGLFGEVILAAPDVPREDFTPQLAARLRPLADRISLYASADDTALKASKFISELSRLGQSGAGLFVAPEIQTIDATGVDTDLLSLAHSYFGEKKKVIDDIAAVLTQRAAPESGQRPLVRKLSTAGVPYWAFVR